MTLLSEEPPVVTPRDAKGVGRWRGRPASPLIAEGHLADRSTGGDTPASCRIAEAHTTGHHPTLVGGHTENLEHLFGMEETEHGGDRTAHPFGPCRQLSAPDSRKDRPSGGIGLHEPEQEEGHLFEVIGQPLGGTLDFQHLDALVRLGVRLGGGQSFRIDGFPELIDRVAVERTDPADDVSIVGQQKPPILGVASGRCPDGGVEHPRLDLQRDRIGADPSHRPGGVQRLIDVHRSSSRSSSVGRCTPPAMVGQRHSGAPAERQSAPGQNVWS